MSQTKAILPIIVVSQFCCTSLWFAGNGVMPNLVENFQLDASAVGHLTSSVQAGFILGTLLFAILSIADRFSPSKVFFVSALLGASFNSLILWDGNTFGSILLSRFMTGFFLAGIYPVGMKIAADYFEKGLGKSLGFLVGALVVGTAFPHLLKSMHGNFPWTYVIICTSVLAALGGALILFLVPDGPFRKPSQYLQLSAFLSIFKDSNFRAASLGYFGHMWELYAFWAFVPIMLTTFTSTHPSDLNVSMLSFLIIGFGGLSCVVGGLLSVHFGPKKIAGASLALSGVCCLISPLLFLQSSDWVFVSFLVFWGLVVIADSPQFSTLVAQSAPPEIKGTALTIVNCLGFAITIVSIQLLSWTQAVTNSSTIYFVLVIGPLFGLISFKRFHSKT